MRGKQGFVLIETMVMLSVVVVFVGLWMGCFSLYTKAYQKTLLFQQKLTLAQNALEAIQEQKQGTDSVTLEPSVDGSTRVTYTIDTYHQIELWIQ